MTTIAQNNNYKELVQQISETFRHGQADIAFPILAKASHQLSWALK